MVPSVRWSFSHAGLWKREELLVTILLLDNVCKPSETLCHFDFRVHSQTLHSRSFLETCPLLQCEREKGEREVRERGQKRARKGRDTEIDCREHERTSYRNCWELLEVWKHYAGTQDVVLMWSADTIPNHRLDEGLFSLSLLCMAVTVETLVSCALSTLLHNSRIWTHATPCPKVATILPASQEHR